MLEHLIERAGDFFTNTVSRFYNNVVCKLVPDKNQQANALLAGIYLQMQALSEGLQAGGTFFRITPYSVTGGGEAVQVLDINTQGRIREVTVCIDSAVGLPDPTIRLSTSGGSPNGNGVRLTPGVFNPIGRIPPNEKLYIASDVTINMFVIEVA